MHWWPILYGILNGFLLGVILSLLLADQSIRWYSDVCAGLAVDIVRAQKVLDQLEQRK